MTLTALRFAVWPNEWQKENFLYVLLLTVLKISRETDVPRRASCEI